MRLPLLLGLFSLSPALLAGQTSLGSSARYAIPTGWHQEQTNGGTYLVCDAVPNGAVVIYLGVRPLKTAFLEGFTQDLTAMSQGQRVMSSTPSQSGATAGGVALLSSRAHLLAPNGGHSFRYYLAANPPGELHMAVYMAATEQLYKAHWIAMQQFAVGWRFDGPSALPAATAGAAAPGSAGPPPPAPVVSVPADRLEGIYSGYKYIYVTVLGVVQKQAALDYYTFFADGTVYWGIVPMLGFDMAAARQKDPEYTGIYSVRGNQVSIALGPANRLVALRSGNLLRIEDREYQLEGDPGKTTARVLDGLFRREDAQPGEELARRSIRFSRDGTFEDQGIVEAITASEIVNGNPVPKRPAGRGWYQLARNTLLLRYSDGYAERLPITIPLPEQSRDPPSKISVNTYSLVIRP